MNLFFRDRIWNSPTFMTWVSMLVRMLTILLVTPLILVKFRPADINLWFLFSSIFALQILADMGFSATFVRIFSFVKGGSTIDDLKMKNGSKMCLQPIKNSVDWVLIEKIFSTSQYIYIRLTLGATFLLLLFTVFLIKPISLTENPMNSWIAWLIIVIGFFIVLRGNVFSAYVQGMNQITLFRRWDAITGLFAIITNTLVLLFDGSLLDLIISYQFWLILGVPRNWLLSRYIEKGKFKTFTIKPTLDSQVFNAIWESAYKSGIGILMYYSVIQFSNFYYAQSENSSKIASYLLCFSLAQQMASFSQAPFYSKIPLLSQLRSKGDIESLIKIARKSMLLTYWLFTIGTITVGFFGNYLLSLIGSNVDFIPRSLWFILCLGLLIERYGALHLQLYSTTNNIVWHIANGFTGILYIFFSLILFPIIDIYAFPLAILISVTTFYSWYSSKKSYESINSNFWTFEKRLFLPVLICNIFICLIIMKEFILID